MCPPESREKGMVGPIPRTPTPGPSPTHPIPIRRGREGYAHPHPRVDSLEKGSGGDDWVKGEGGRVNLNPINTRGGRKRGVVVFVSQSKLTYIKDCNSILPTY